MPTVSQPLGLLELCHRRCGSLVYDACCTIEGSYGDYDNRECASAIANLRTRLLVVLVSVLDDVGERAVQRHWWLRTLRDSRILYALLLHNKTESFSVPTGHPDKHAFTRFVCKNLSQLTNLVRLDLSGIECSDTMLEIIANTCNKLKSLVLNMPDQFASNAISNSGFACLASLENLRVLKHSSDKQFENIDKAVILELLKAQKNLEEIDYCLIGEVVDDYARLIHFSSRSNGMDGHEEEIRPLALTCIKIDTYFSVDRRTGKFTATSGGPSPNIILSLAKTCPNLNHLELLNFDTCSDSVRKQFIDNLSNSSIILSTLALEGFSVNDSFKQLLKTKGTHLKTFMFSPLQVSRRDLEVIGEWCPNIPNLRFTKTFLADVEDDEYGCSRRVFSITGGVESKSTVTLVRPHKRLYFMPTGEHRYLVGPPY